MKTELRAELHRWGKRIDFALLVHEENETTRLGRLSLEPLPDTTHIVNPTLSLDMNAAQLLMDELWHCGLRPSEGSGSAGSLAATQKHLEDMRAIAFTSMGIEKK